MTQIEAIDEARETALVAHPAFARLTAARSTAAPPTFACSKAPAAHNSAAMRLTTGCNYAFPASQMPAAAAWQPNLHLGFRPPPSPLRSLAQQDLSMSGSLLIAESKFCDRGLGDRHRRRRHAAGLLSHTPSVTSHAPSPAPDVRTGGAPPAAPSAPAATRIAG
eukprot:349759-Chlamydomonas_euryale.AAC.2